MAARSTRKTTTKTTTKKVSSQNLAEMWKSRCYGAVMILLLIILGMMVGGIGFYMSIKDNIVSDEDLAALGAFDEVAETFVNGFDLVDGTKTHADVSGYGISPDGDFYIGYKLNYLDENNEITKSRDGKVYFWSDKETGKRSFGFGYDD